MNFRRFARELGRRGGRARTRRLSAAQRRRIALLGGRSRARSLQLARRIVENFRYVNAINKLAGRSNKVTNTSGVKSRLPGIYA